MARPKKNNADYFPHDREMRNDARIRALRCRYSHMGYAVWCFLMEVLTASENFRLILNELSYEIYAGDFNVTADELKEVIAYCVKIELLQMSEDGVLSCKYLDESLAVLVEKRQRERDRFLTQKTPLNDNFCNENSVINDVSAAETRRNDVDNGISAAENPQSKVKESKVKLTTFALPRTTRTRKGDVGGWTGNDATTYDDVDSEVADLKTGEIWREQVFMRYKFLNHDGKLLDEYIDRWAQEVKISGKRHQCLGDAKKHFGSWMTIQEGKISKINNHGTAQQLTAQQRINEGKIRGAQHVAELLAQNDACLRDSVQD